MIGLSIVWVLSNLALMIVVYHGSEIWGPTDPTGQNNMICVVDPNSGCFNAGNRVWLFINILFIALLIMSLLWAGELGNQDSGPLRTMSGVIILLGGLLLTGFIYSKIKAGTFYMIPFWVSVLYLLIWFGLTLYVTLNIPS